jgi:signal transduction histidine kinase
MRPRYAEPLKVALWYALFGALWIMGSDQLLLMAVRDPETLTYLQSIKGYAYVSITALLLYALVRQSVRRIRRAEAQAWQAQKMEALGRLAAAVSHDMNNVLGAMTTMADLVAEDLGPGHPQHGNLQAIGDAGGRGRALVRQLMAFTRQQPVQPRALALDAELRAHEPLLKRLVKGSVSLSLDLGSPQLRVSMDPVHLEQVLLNLVANASDAIDGAGAVVLATGREGRWAVVSVQDTGAGMDQAVQSRAFEPFFTTKPEGVGTGLGLATVYGIVQQAGGQVSIRSRRGEGTTISVRLPALA